MWAGLTFAWLGVVGAGEVAQQQIEWDAVEGCPSQAAIVEATREWLGRSLAEFPRAVLAQARVEAARGGYRMRLTLEVDGVSERHEVSGTDCDRLGWDAALLIASAVDPFALGPRAPRERQLLVTPVVVQHPRTRPRVHTVIATVPTRPDPVEDELDPQIGQLNPVDRPEAPARGRPGPVTGALGVAGTTFVGLFPQIGGGVELEGGIERGLFRWQLAAAGWFGGSFRASDTNVGADLWAASGTTGPCVIPSVRRFRFAACAVGGAGVITASSVNTTGPSTSPRPWAYAGADLRATWSPVPRAAVFIGLAVLPAVARPAWSVNSPDVGFRIPPVAGLLRFGVELRRLGGGRALFTPGAPG
jgi:hypothetical protein